MYFKVRRLVSCQIYSSAIYVQQKEIPRRTCNELLKVISGEVNPLALPLMSPKWNYDRGKRTLYLLSQL